MQTDLPIADVLESLAAALKERHEVVLEAPPGSGKTTIVPLALMGQPWLGYNKILMLEPRRIAARTAAQRMAELLGEKPGQTVGYRMRLETRVGPQTKIEVITEGILTRMLHDDPSLADVGLVIFDEFHERNLDADIALALALKGRELFRDSEPLRILVMSATLDRAGVATMLGDAPIIRGDGRLHAVDIHYGTASQPRTRIAERAASETMNALRTHPDSSILVFLPGQGEISSCEALLKQQVTDPSVDIMPLYGNLSIDAQQAAITPSINNRRKIVIATNIAETSLTIDGVDVVVDSGLAREPVYDPVTGMSRLETRKISRDSSTQRAGRAGRLRPGHCYRLWSASQQDQLSQHVTPEILAADLCPLALQVLSWGIGHPDELRWLDPPPASAFQQAVDLLQDFGALIRDDDKNRLTAMGDQMAQLPVHPRLAHLLIEGAATGFADTACLLAAVLSERDPFADDIPDMAHRIEILTGQSACPGRFRGWAARVTRLAGQYQDQLSKLDITSRDGPAQDAALGYLIAMAYPDRIARQRHSGGFQLANGRSANLADRQYFSKNRWLAVAEVGGIARRKGDMIRSAAVLDETLFENLLAHRVETVEVVEWDKREKRFIAEKRSCIGALTLSRERLATVPAQAKRAALLALVREQGLGLLPLTPQVEQWRARVNLARRHLPDETWPDASDAGLLSSLEAWLAPWLDAISHLNDFRKLDLQKVLASTLSYEAGKRLDEIAPERIEVPSGSHIRIDYTVSPPVLAVKLQEMFGCEETPTVLQGREPLLVHLLSPAGRPVQVTQDLAGFWRSSYDAVKKDMKGRYPKHPWPDDPFSATATARTRNATNRNKND